MHKRRIPYAKPLTGRKIRTTYVRRPLQPSSTNQQDFQKKKKDSNPFLLLCPFSTLRVVERSEHGKYTGLNCDWTKSRKSITAPIVIEDLMEKKVQLSLQNSDIRKMSFLADPSNEDTTCIKRKIRIVNHPKNLIEVLRARLAISQGLTGNNITTGPKQHRFTRTFLDGEALHVFDLKPTELHHKTVANLTTVTNHVVAYFRPK